MATQLDLDDIRRAWEARDPELVQYIALLATQPDKQPATPIREGALTFAKFLREINSYQFRKKTPANYCLPPPRNRRGRARSRSVLHDEACVSVDPEKGERPCLLEFIFLKAHNKF